MTQPPTRSESFFAITKSLIIRALIIYFVSSFLRRSSTPDTETPTAVGPQQPDAVVSRLPAINFFNNGTLFDLHGSFIKFNSSFYCVCGFNQF